MKVIVCLSVVFCIGCNSNHKITTNLPNDDLKKHVEFVLSSIDYVSREIMVKNNEIEIIGDTNFTDSKEGNNVLMNYLYYKIATKFSSINLPRITIKYKKTVIMSPTCDRAFIESKDSNYWIYSEHGLKNFDIYDDVYYSITSKEMREVSNYNFGDDIWSLILELSQRKKNAQISLFAFYDWGKVPYNDNLIFDRSKLDFFLKDIGVDKDKINEIFVDSVYKSNGYPSFFW